MAGQDRAQSDHLSLFRTAAANARRFGFFALLRAAEGRASALPRVGRSRTPAQNVATLAEAPALGFPETTLDSIGFDRAGRARVEGRFLGLTGPMGPLPLHLTEYAIYERRYGKARPFGRFLDLLAERMLQFFYRAWADSQPLAHADRPEDDRFAGYLAALSGAGEGAREDSALPLQARLHYAGLFAGRRSAAALQDGLSHLLGTPVTLREFRTRWRDIEPEDRTRLGRTGAFNALGRDAVLGGRVCSAEDAFQVVVKARSMAEYADLLPSGRRYAIAAEALTAFAPSHLDWEIELEIDEAAASSARLDGAAALGWTSWAALEGRPRLRADSRLRRGADIRRPAA